MLLRAVIVDDEERAREILRHFLGKYRELQVIGEGASGEEAILLAQRFYPDAIFLDVKMPGMDGMEAARVISEFPDPPSIIFTTAYEEHAVGAFEVEALDYLVKPYTVERINAAVERLLTRKRREQEQQRAAQNLIDRLNLTVPRRLSFEMTGPKGEKSAVFINEDSIIFAEARGRHVRLVTDKGEYEVNINLGEVAKWLDPRQFFKSHRSYLVNTAKIVEIKATGRTYGVVLADDPNAELIPLSRERIDELKELLSSPGK